MRPRGSVIGAVAVFFASVAVVGAEDITSKMPRVERGELKNTPPPAPKKQPSILEKSPVQPTVVGPERKRPEDPKPVPGVKVTIPTR
jgi:hypothetical protein